MNTINSLFPCDLTPHERATLTAMRHRSIMLTDRIFRLKGAPTEKVSDKAVIGLLGMKLARCAIPPEGAPVEIVLTGEGRDMEKRCRAYEKIHNPMPPPMIKPLSAVPA